ncbi:hypothetical protein, partial [Thiolapillus sp.]|uniref:hypothetical protein n=1 Tax=Thiolapillus sp. TaxID=2017437 RepID=UPI003AF9EABD
MWRKRKRLQLRRFPKCFFEYPYRHIKNTLIYQQQAISWLSRPGFQQPEALHGRCGHMHIDSPPFQHAANGL